MKNSKKALSLAVALTALLTVTGCEGYSQNKCYESVKQAYPNADVIMIPGKKYRFIVKEESGGHYLC